MNQKVKWLRLLLCFYVASFAVWALGYLPIFDRLSQWGDILVSAGIILCLFQSSPFSKRYRGAAILKSISLVRMVFYALLPATVLFSMVQMPYYAVVITVIGFVELILSWLATYLEHRGHGELIVELDPKLSKKWMVLFLCRLSFAILGTVLSYAVGHLYEVLHWGIGVINVVFSVVQFGNKILLMVYLWFLYKTIRLVKQ